MQLSWRSAWHGVTTACLEQPELATNLLDDRLHLRLTRWLEKIKCIFSCPLTKQAPESKTATTVTRVAIIGVCRMCTFASRLHRASSAPSVDRVCHRQPSTGLHKFVLAHLVAFKSTRKSTISVRNWLWTGSFVYSVSFVYTASFVLSNCSCQLMLTVSTALLCNLKFVISLHVSARVA